MSLLDHPDAKAMILHWSEMGSRWGVTRSAAQMHALLYLSDRPLPAEEIVERLGLARSNVSTGLREVQAYGLVRRIHLEGDRRDHFTAEHDPWTMLLAVAAERKRRELDPMLAALARLADRVEGDRNAPDHLRERIAGLHAVAARLDGWYGEVVRLPRPTLVALVKLGGKVARLLPARKKG